MHMHRANKLVGLLLLATIVSTARAQQESVRPGINDNFKNPDAVEFVKRFEREGRDVYDHREQIVQACGIKPGMAIADVGAGTGLFTRLFSPLVGPQGRVYAVDIARNFIDRIEATCKEQNLNNVVGVVCTQDDVTLPPASVDLIFICDTYHHFEFPTKTIQTIHKALRPDGQIVLIDFRRIKGKTTEWIYDHVRAGQEVFTQEITEAGFEQIEEKDFLGENYFLRFRKVSK